MSGSGTRAINIQTSSNHNDGNAGTIDDLTKQHVLFDGYLNITVPTKENNGIFVEKYQYDYVQVP